MEISNKELYRRLLTEFVFEEDPLLSMLQWLMDRMMEAEVESRLGASKHEHSKSRKSHLSGYRPRRFDTRLGTVYLMIPKVRKGGYVPFFVSEKQRSEQALIALVQESFVNGVSTRKVKKVLRSLGVENISAGQVSNITKGLDEQVEEFRTATLDETYPFIWIDAIYEKIRQEDRKVVSTAIMVAYGLSLEGERRILSVEPFPDESAECWKDFFQKLKKRGLKNSALIFSDAHSGIQAAVKEEMAGSGWQRCKVHFMRNILAGIPHRAKKDVAAKLKQIWLQPDYKTALKVAKMVIDEYGTWSKAMKCLEEGLEDGLQFYHYEGIDHRKISSTNPIERLNKEIRRRSRVVGVFPSKEAYLRLIVTYFIEYSEEWIHEKRAYIKQEHLETVMIKFYENKMAV
ncbi:IS256 family transposase [Chitinivibrio alkaliphilus]|uniref:Mutator family transposase n=1 Tax=Chitinivibrio alkaliphilus ACht1 TaxID=1313304 RepID=U7D2E0_9BACT|nr:IS256 family transposase [Chitinivibrio alkaliphilus]ERP30669.1 transposase, mutator type [Chitinivibrio alkaliphilus ACht1]